MEAFGWIGATLLAVCGLPQMIEALRVKNAHGLTGSFIGMWFFGELFTLIYVFPKLDWPLILNYCVNLCFLAPIIWYKLFPED